MFFQWLFNGLALLGEKVHENFCHRGYQFSRVDHAGIDCLGLAGGGVDGVCEFFRGVDDAHRRLPDFGSSGLGAVENIVRGLGAICDICMV
jgi:hypothetical protein